MIRNRLIRHLDTTCLCTTTTTWLPHSLALRPPFKSERSKVWEIIQYIHPLFGTCQMSTQKLQSIHHFSETQHFILLPAVLLYKPDQHYTFWDEPPCLKPVRNPARTLGLWLCYYKSGQQIVCHCAVLKWRPVHRKQAARFAVIGETGGVCANKINS